MKVLVIGNPIAGGGRGRARVEALGRYLRERGHEAEIRLSERRGHAGEHAARIPTEVERLLVVGGDGTLNEVLNGLPDPSRLPLLQLPTGTANILAHDLSLPFDAAGAAALLEEGALRRVDMGVANGRRFLMLVSAGFDALVTREIARHRTGPLGYRGYVAPILRALRRYRRPRLRVSVDGGEPLACGLVIATNTRNYGGLFTVCREARPDSGHLDTVLLTRASRSSLVGAALRGLLRGVSDAPGVLHIPGRRVRVESDEPVPVEIDGDYRGSTPVEIELHPHHVPVVAPPPGRDADSTYAK